MTTSLRLTDDNLIRLCDVQAGVTKDELATQLSTSPMAVVGRLSRLVNQGKLFRWQSYLGGAPRYYARWEHAQFYMRNARATAAGHTSNAASAPFTPAAPAICELTIHPRAEVAPYTVARAGADDFRRWPSRGPF